ncbi:uncharacterized protein LOC109604301 isoform X2 [Aethina tumida]|uniref:uncharacterized protein LOC109604301 isoform X2 n=1 Tax=Aethina tumida TaxID=116153 RepID=UPI002147A64D|nr:uncharacterized protein LOC109604301 isoform X2 [Aethina tumida]
MDAMDIEPPSDPIFKMHDSSENLETLYSLFEGVDDDMDSSVNDVFRVLDSFPDSDHDDSDSSEENDLIYISDVDAAFMLAIRRLRSNSSFNNNDALDSSFDDDDLPPTPMTAHDEMNNSSDNDDELASSFNNSVKLDSASTPPFGTTGEQYLEGMMKVYHYAKSMPKKLRLEKKFTSMYEQELQRFIKLTGNGRIRMKAHELERRVARDSRELVRGLRRESQKLARRDKRENSGEMSRDLKRGRSESLLNLESPELVKRSRRESPGLGSEGRSMELDSSALGSIRDGSLAGGRMAESKRLERGDFTNTLRLMRSRNDEDQRNAI